MNERMDSMSKKIAMIPINKIVPHPKLKEDLDEELLKLMDELCTTHFNSRFSEPVVQHGLSYLDALCSIRFDVCPRNDKRKIVQVLEMVIKKTNDLMTEAKRGI